MSKIETSLLTDQVYNVLKSKIIDGEYMPGEKLDIHKLSDEFGVSRSPVKDAINQLVHDGLIEIIPRKGTYVTQLDLTTFLETLDARLMVEIWAAKQALSSLTGAKLVELRKIVEQMDDIINKDPFSFEQYNELDMNFHHCIVKQSSNQTIFDLYVSFNTHIALSRIVRSTSFTSTLKRHQDHWEMYKAIEEQNFTAFLETVSAHIESLKEDAMRIFGEEKDKNNKI